MIPDAAQDVCRCAECGLWLAETPSGFWACPMLHGRLIPRPMLRGRIAVRIRCMPAPLRRASPTPLQILDLLGGSQSGAGPVVLHESAFEPAGK